jgi:endo-1,4-beta-D-glucanase Y
MESLKLKIVTALFMLILPLAAFADDTLWNMPYMRPAKYNYLSYFSSDVNISLTVDPGWCKNRLTTGWNYYKNHFIMSNGLVMQMTGSGVGTTTAVSEGIGYGMLLALINNDQATFNKIFQAGNQYMWNSGHNSYYNWKIVNGGVSGSGAATDAELDICLALIFADKLQKNSAVTRWTAYNSGGVTYASRATQILASIKTNMTSNNYLLPGDNWRDAGISNLNPSYFATGFFRVFDQFQTAYQFAPVAASCYSVLKARSAQYAKGQAPDWCTSSGGQASQPASGQTYQGLGMTDDGIRTPWRICMDALWFDNADAKAFCSNSRNTLTKYTQTAANPTALLTQLAQYTNTQTSIVTTAGSFHIIAMWLCGAMGSKDAAYTKQCVNGTLLLKIAGQSVCFGDPSLSDQYYYYNQSLGMLGFAAITGMFPNVLADDIKTVNVAAFPRRAPALTFRGVSVGADGLRFTLPRGFSESRGGAVELFNMKGQGALTISPNRCIVTADGACFAPIGAGRLAPGMYFVKIRSGAARDYSDKILWK